MKKFIALLSLLAIYTSLTACGPNNNDNEEKTPSETHSITTEPEKTTLSQYEACDMADDYVRDALKMNFMFDDATAFSVTDHEFTGMGKYGLTEKKDYYEFVFYGTAIWKNHYDEITESKNFKATIKVPVDGAKHDIISEVSSES